MLGYDVAMVVAIVFRGVMINELEEPIIILEIKFHWVLFISDLLSSWVSKWSPSDK